MGIAESLKRGLSLTRDTAGEGAKFGKRGFVDSAKYFVMGYLALLAVVVVEIAFLALLYFVALPAIGNVATTGIAAASGVVAAIVMVLLPIAAEFGAIQFIYSGKKVGYFEGGNLWAAFKWSLFLLAVLMVIGVPIALLLFAFGTSGMEVSMASTLLQPVVLLISVVVGLALYYAHQEIAVRGKGPFGAVGASIGIVKKNFWETALFAVLLYAVSEAITAIPVTILVFGAMMGGIGMLLSPALLLIGIPVIIVLVLGLLAIALVVETGATILKVGFYWRVAGRKPGKPPSVGAGE